jgi:hypothetical protein
VRRFNADDMRVLPWAEAEAGPNNTVTTRWTMRLVDPIGEENLARALAELRGSSGAVSASLVRGPTERDLEVDFAWRTYGGAELSKTVVALLALEQHAEIATLQGIEWKECPFQRT